MALGDNWVEDYCIKTGVYWKISANLDANGNTTISSVEYLPADGTSTAIDPALATSFGKLRKIGVSSNIPTLSAQPAESTLLFKYAKY